MSLDTYSLQFPFIVLSSVDPVESEPGIAMPQSNFCCACGVQEVWKCTRPRLERKRHESMFENVCRNTAARRMRKGGCSSGDSKGTAQPSANGLRHSRVPCQEPAEKTSVMRMRCP